MNVPRPRARRHDWAHLLKMSDPPDCMSVIAGMTSSAESTRKLAAYHLQGLVADASFADAFVQADGMPILRTAVMEENGNALAYALGSLTRLLEMNVGWEAMGSEIIERVRANPVQMQPTCIIRILRHGSPQYRLFNLLLIALLSMFFAMLYISWFS